MVRKTFYLSPELERLVSSYAQRISESESGALREIIRAFFKEGVKE